MTTTAPHPTTTKEKLDSARQQLLDEIAAAVRPPGQPTFSPSPEHQMMRRDEHRTAIEIARVRYEYFLVLLRDEIEAAAETQRAVQVQASHNLAERSASIQESQVKIARQATRATKAMRKYTWWLTVAAGAQVVCAAFQAYAAMKGH